MSDNVQISVGTGATIGTDEVTDATLGTVQIQYTKLMDGTLNGTNKTTVDASGNLGAKPLPAVISGTLNGSGQYVYADNTYNTNTYEVEWFTSAGFVGTIALSFSADGTNWANRASYDNYIPSSGSSLNLSAGQSDRALAHADFKYFGVTCTSYTSGSLSIRITQKSEATLQRNSSYSSTSAIGDYNNPTRTATVTAAGALTVIGATGSNIIGKVGIDQTTPGTTNAHSISHIGSTAVVVSKAGALGVGGDTASASTDAGNPLKIGGLAVSSVPTSITTGQRANALYDTMGRMVVAPQIRQGVKFQSTTITSSTAANTIITAVALTYNDLTHLTITNGSASATAVTINDGTTALGVYNIPAGGGIVLPFPTPVSQTTANTNWTATCSVSVASIYVSAVYQTSK